MEKRLDGKVALVTGSGGLIGPAVVRRLAAEGAAVAVTDLSAAVAEALAAEIIAAGGRSCAVKLDVTCRDEVDAAFTQVEQTLGPVDILVNNAGLLCKRGTVGFDQVEEDDWSRILEVNLGGAMRCCRRVLGGMLERGHGAIINVASIAGVSGLPGWADYAAAKGGIIAFSKTLAMEAGSRAVTVNCVSPGMIAAEPNPNPGTWLGHSGTPQDVAALIAFLASPEATYLTGGNYMVDGGRVVGPKNASWQP